MVMLKPAIDTLLRLAGYIQINTLFPPNIHRVVFMQKWREHIGTSLKMSNLHLLKMSGSPLNILMYLMPWACLIPIIPLGKLEQSVLALE